MKRIGLVLASGLLFLSACGSDGTIPNEVKDTGKDNFPEGWVKACYWRDQSNYTCVLLPDAKVWKCSAPYIPQSMQLYRHVRTYSTGKTTYTRTDWELDP